jgi:hypothetical protein
MATVNKNTVFDIYTGILGLLPPKAAIDWLTSSYAGKPLDVAANLILDAFQKDYNAGVDDANLLSTASNTNFVKAVYARFFGLTAAELAKEADGVNYWTNYLNNLPKEADQTNGGRGSLISTMLDVALDKTQYVGNAVVEKARALLTNREAVSEHYLQKGGAVDDQSWARKIISDVTQSSSSVDSAKTAINSKTAAGSGDNGGNGAGNLVINGTEANDWLDYTGSNDPVTINGLGGDDWIHGGIGNDILNGGAGDDLLFGNKGNDSLNGGAGSDCYYYSGVNDYFPESYGHDTIYDESGEDIIDAYALKNKTGKELSFKHSGNDFIVTLAPTPGTPTVITIKDFYAGHPVEWLDVFCPDKPTPVGKSEYSINLVAVANSVADGATLTPTDWWNDLQWDLTGPFVYHTIWNG